ncbi:AMP-binding protein, partial [Nocardiopsis terrae]|uniref:AMP-binding protein n=1 Tax=Nocardiopsis terrae TaxID=372655 RepID=UPI00174846F9
ALDVVSWGERSRVVEGFNDTGRVLSGGSLVGAFEEQVARTPEATAVVCGDEAVSYGRLNARANRLARRLVEAGAGPERVVAVVLPRSVDLVVAVLGVLKSGAAYVPVDPEYPVERVRFMLEDSAPVAAVTVSGVAGCVGEGVARVLLDVESLEGYADGDVGDGERSGVLCAEHPAYVIYTSGSTGRPKAVV